MKKYNPLTSEHMKKSEWDKTWRKEFMDREDKEFLEKNTVSKRSSRYFGHSK